MRKGKVKTIDCNRDIFKSKLFSMDLYEVDYETKEIECFNIEYECLNTAYFEDAINEGRIFYDRESAELAMIEQGEIKE